jgi:hypothetical protein
MRKGEIEAPNFFEQLSLSPILWSPAGLNIIGRTTQLINDGMVQT